MSIDIKLFDVKEPDFSEVFEELAKEGQAKMKGIVQKRSGETAAGVSYIVSKNGYEIYGGSAGGDNTWYKWHLIEYGTPKMAAFPFVRPVAKILTQKNEEAIIKVLEKSVKLK